VLPDVTSSRTYNVLFLCTGNSARSILAESLLNHSGEGRCRAFSAGSFPKGAVHPLALEVLKAAHLPTEGLRSKSWGEFAKAGAPLLDVIITVCDNAAGEVCPVWPGKPTSTHWGIPDPAAVQGTHGERVAAFRRALEQLKGRITRFLALPLESLDSVALRERLKAIGREGS
jgi:arsenate reductase (thioredoxin)